MGRLCSREPPGASETGEIGTGFHVFLLLEYVCSHSSAGALITLEGDAYRELGNHLTPGPLHQRTPQVAYCLGVTRPQNPLSSSISLCTGFLAFNHKASWMREQRQG